MKYKVLSWESGVTKDSRDPCVFVVALETPGWFARKVFKARPRELSMYGEKGKYSYRWYFAETGSSLDSECKFYDCLNHWVSLRKNQEEAAATVARMQMAVKT